MCPNYESQLQAVQESEKKAQGQVRVLERQLHAEREAVSNQQQYLEELEQNLKVVAVDVEQQVCMYKMNKERRLCSDDGYCIKCFLDFKTNHWNP